VLWRLVPTTGRSVTIWGTWDVEPFGNDDAADFAFELDDASASGSPPRR
jgi:hypothetical protein